MVHHKKAVVIILPLSISFVLGCLSFSPSSQFKELRQIRNGPIMRPWKCTKLLDATNSSCDFGPPSSLKVWWNTESSEALIKWSAPLTASPHGLEYNYSLVVLANNSEVQVSVLDVILPQTVDEITLPNLSRYKHLLIDVHVVVEAMRGEPASVELLLEDPPVRFFLPLIVSLGINCICGIVLVILLAGSSHLRVIHSERITDETKSKLLLSPSVKSTVTESKSLGKWPPHLRPYFISFNDIELHKELGRGSYGVVYQGEISIGRRKEIVAVKKYLTIFFEHAENEVLREVELMQTLGRHVHIVSLIGFAISPDECLLVLQYCPLKDLRSWLKNLKAELNSAPSGSKSAVYIHPHCSSLVKESFSQWPDSMLSAKQWTRLLIFMYQVADGMEHIARCNVVHCDIAARNILVYSPTVVKIADFGLSRKVGKGKKYVPSRERQLPVRWMSVEALAHKAFTVKSDVWAYGVLLWEIATLGKHPYSAIHDSEIYHTLLMGERLPEPRGCISDLYDVMTACWRSIPLTRPNFTVLKGMIEHILEQRQGYLQL